ncbi:MAG: FGGY-family carbohydrate kinase, partial [Thiohalomonadales bacterium]
DSARYGVYSQPLFEHWLVGGASNTGGAVLKNYFSAQQIQTLSRQVEPNIDTGLDYYPLLCTGERFPVYDINHAPKLSPRPENELTFFQGILEGIAKIEKMGYDRLHTLGAPYPTRIITMGGGAKNSLWRQMRERILGIPVSAAKIQDAAYGAALLAKGKK